MIDRFSANATPSAPTLVREGWARPLWRGRGNVHERYYGEETLLHKAASRGNVYCARVLLAHGADVNANDCEQWTPLHYAAWRGHLACVCVLLLFKANVHATDVINTTALDRAIKYNHQTVCKLLRVAMKK